MGIKSKIFGRGARADGSEADADRAEDGAPVSATALRLVHPVYLNTPMMFSFLAAIQGGYATESEVERSETKDARLAKAASLKASVASLLGVIGLGAEGSLEHTRGSEESIQTNERRQHTEASLFNLLLGLLADEVKVQSIDERADVVDLETGDLVEISGEIAANPLEQLLDLYVRFAPYLGVTTPLGSVKRSLASLVKDVPEETPLMPIEQIRSAIARKDPQELKVINMILDELRNAPVCDLVLDPGFHEEASPGISESNIVLTLSREFLNVESAHYLVGGQFTVLGKVTRVLTNEGDAINLSRRAAIGALGARAAHELIVNYPIKNLETRIARPVVGTPAAQVLPLAIYV